jgi:hypothetical protein
LAPLEMSLEEGKEAYESDASTDIDISWADIEEEALSAFASLMLGNDIDDAPIARKNDDGAGEDEVAALSPPPLSLQGLEAYNVSSFPEAGQGGNVDVDGVAAAAAAAVAAVHQHTQSQRQHIS